MIEASKSFFRHLAKIQLKELCEFTFHQTVIIFFSIIKVLYNQEKRKLIESIKMASYNNRVPEKQPKNANRNV